MKLLPVIFLWLPLANPAISQVPRKSGLPLYSKQNLVAWCIVPYDSKKRSPSERALMLKKLGIQSFAYDWRANDLPFMETEIAAIKQEGIKLKSVWFWVNGSGKVLLDSANEKILTTLKKTQTRTELWVSFPENYLDGMTESEKLDKAVKDVRHIHSRAKEIGCTIALYNHGAWFGEPVNQVKIIQASGISDIGIVYNFHHAHQQLDRYEEILRITKPYLTTVNLDGVKPEGPKILTIGEGTHEMEMMRKLRATGFSGSIGIIGHTENEDVEEVLSRNLEGLQKILRRMQDVEALKTYN